MAEAALAALGTAAEAGLVVVPEGGPVPAVSSRVRCVPASHPVPDRRSLAAADAALAVAREAGPDTLLLVLLSGGASALLAAPAPGLTLRDQQDVTAALLASGADVHAINVVRRHCSAIKGGGLVRAASRAGGVWTLALSDVVDDDPAAIGSGPTSADPSTFADAAAVLDRWVPGTAPAIRAAMDEGAAGRRAETVKPGDPMLDRTCYVVVGSNAVAVSALADAASAAGYEVVRLGRALTGDAAREGEALAGRLLGVPDGGRPIALVAGGEPTVGVVAGGRGGRAQQLALAAAPALAGSRALLRAAGTDGVDGPTDAAGAWVDGMTMADAARLGVDVGAALAATDAYPVLARLGSLVRTGPTGTNVADVVVGLRAC
jgi:glycerate 2-kinase